MPDDCQHQWIVLPWYRLCSLCYVPDREVVDAWGYADEDIIRDLNRPWVYITTKDPIFMDLVMHQRCPSCGKITTEETLQRADGSISTGFTCTGCDARWWVESENDERRD